MWLKITFTNNQDLTNAKRQYRVLIAGVKQAREERDFEMYSNAIGEFIGSWVGIIKAGLLVNWENHLYSTLDDIEFRVRQARKCIIEEWEMEMYHNVKSAS